MPPFCSIWLFTFSFVSNLSYNEYWHPPNLFANDFLVGLKCLDRSCMFLKETGLVQKQAGKISSRTSLKEQYMWICYQNKIISCNTQKADSFEHGSSVTTTLLLIQQDDMMNDSHMVILLILVSCRPFPQNKHFPCQEWILYMSHYSSVAWLLVLLLTRFSVFQCISFTINIFCLTLLVP